MCENQSFAALGLVGFQFLPTLTPWAVFLRRSAANHVGLGFNRIVEILALPHTAAAGFSVTAAVRLGRCVSDWMRYGVPLPRVLHGFAEVFGGEGVEDVFFGQPGAAGLQDAVSDFVEVGRVVGVSIDYDLYAVLFG
jgi:hypothetical protein